MDVLICFHTVDTEVGSNIYP